MLEVKSKSTSKSKAALLDLVFIALFAAVITVCAQIQIPFGQVPFTLQTLGIFIASSLLGWKRGTISVLVYVLLGLVGVPVFAVIYYVAQQMIDYVMTRKKLSIHTDDYIHLLSIDSVTNEMIYEEDSEMEDHEEE